jgi:hypothetical protein
MNPFSRVLSGYAAPPSDPAQMVLHSMLGVLESYWAEDNSIVTPSPNAHRDVVTYLGNRFGERAPVVNYAKTLWQARLTR